jgi:hypothetical protein
LDSGNSTRTIEEKLRALKSLREKGLISEEEYTERKTEILDDFLDKP